MAQRGGRARGRRDRIVGVEDLDTPVFKTYFTLAVAAHIRADDTKNLPTPAAIVLVSVAALVLRLSTL